MLSFLLYFLVFFGNGFCLWTNGIIHFAINTKDYDLHSQDIITEVIREIERDICVKFFESPPDYFASVKNKILYINNPDKKKQCTPNVYNYTGSIVDMAIGYKCLNKKEIVRTVVEMLRASIVERSATTVNSQDLVRRFQEQASKGITSLLSPADRNYINAHYHAECQALTPAQKEARRFAPHVEVHKMSAETDIYYRDKIWPLGIIMYGIEKQLRGSQQATDLKYAMNTIELGSCLVFREVGDDDELKAKSLLWFGREGDEAPQLGFFEGNQTISLSTMVTGARGHTAHTINNLLRAVGVPMQSNRHDRDYYVIVNWNNVEKGKEHYLEKTPEAAFLRDSPFGYDFDSVTHAPANFMCREAVCAKGEATVTAAQDHLWQRALRMGHSADLSDGDKEILRLIYSQSCLERHT